MSKPVVLFVDDEPQVLDGLRTRLYRQRRVWDLHFVDSGRAALALMSEQPVDVVISDLRMPEMDGATLLSEVCRRWPRTTRIAMSGQAESGLALRAAGVSHQFIAKPSEPGVIEDAISRVCELRAAIGDEAVLSMVGRIDRLPPLPRIYSQLVEALAREDVTSAQLAAIIKRDVAMSAKVLQMVNSAFFRLSRSIATVDEAVVYLGFNTIKYLSLAAELFGREVLSEAARAEVAALQDHAMRTAYLAQHLAPPSVSRDDAFVAGLLHDVGKLVLVTESPEHLKPPRAPARQLGVPMHAAELDLYGMTHAQIGGYLLGLWGLPESVVEAAAFHHSPERLTGTTLDLCSLTLVANLLVAYLDGSQPQEGAAYDQDLALLERYGLARGLDERMAQWRALIDNGEQPPA